MTPTLAGNPPPRKTRLQRRAVAGAENGFTLLEILLVLTIIGLAGALLVPRLSSFDTRGFNIEVREAAGLLNHARRNAIVSGNPATVSFVPETNDAPVDDDYEIPVFSAGVFKANNIELHFLDSAGDREAVRRPLEITFFPEGGSTGGSLLLLRDDRSAAISVDPATGRLETVFDDETPG